MRVSTYVRALIQRVSRAEVTVHGSRVGEIADGLLIFLGIHKEDSRTQVEYVSSKVLGLRIFPGEDGKMNKSVVETGGSILLVSQFTLYGDCRRGRRPSFDEAASPAVAKTLYEQFALTLRQSGLQVETGMFQQEMLVTLTNNGPVTLLLDSAR